jgi:hypothetical protein
VTTSLQKIRTTAYAGFEIVALKMLCSSREPARAIRIHLLGAVIHFAFTSRTLSFAICVAARRLTKSTARRRRDIR